MFNFFKSSKDDTTPAQLELISVHIPKSAGTSFRNTLKKEYGSNAVIRLDIHQGKKVVRINEKVYEGTQLPGQVRVVHGHFCPADLQASFDIPPDIPIITWLRDPVERVISNYFYLSEILAKELDEQKKGLNILGKMQRTLMEYAQARGNRNRSAKFLRGVSLNELAFVGIQEYYGEDLAAMSQQFGWQAAEEFKYNKTSKKYEVTEEERAAIAALNELDMALYQEALELRNARIAASA